MGDVAHIVESRAAESRWEGIEEIMGTCGEAWGRGVGENRGQILDDEFSEFVVWEFCEEG